MNGSHSSPEFQHLPPAAHHPVRDPTWHTEVQEIARVALLMGRTLMPWQWKALEVATEYRLDSLGRRVYRYGVILITVPRQSGKTTLTGPLQVHRALTRGGPAAVWYTAQSGQDARKRMVELIELVEDSKLRAVLTSQRSNGAEGLRVPSMPGCHVTRFSPTFSALHGEHPHLVTMDEIWHYSRELGEALLGAADPAQITLGNRAQILLTSTMGTLESEFMNRLVETGRAGTDPNLCYIEYSLPEGLEPFDPDSWWRFHPALGNTIAVEDLATRAEKSRDDPAKRATFLRAYCNRLTASTDSLIDLAVWDDLAEQLPAPDRDAVTLALEVSPGNDSAAIVAAWRDAATGRPAVRIVHQAPGVSWLPGEAQRLAEEWGAPLAADGGGPVGRVVAKLRELGQEIRTLTMGEYGQACEGFLDAAAVERTLVVPPHPGSDALRSQVAAVEVRTSNGVRRFSRDDSPRPIPALIAAAVALHAHDNPADTFSGVL